MTVLEWYVLMQNEKKTTFANNTDNQINKSVVSK